MRVLISIFHHWVTSAWSGIIGISRLWSKRSLASNELFPVEWVNMSYILSETNWTALTRITKRSPYQRASTIQAFVWTEPSSIAACIFKRFGYVIARGLMTIELWTTQTRHANWAWHSPFNRETVLLHGLKAWMFRDLFHLPVIERQNKLCAFFRYSNTHNV